MKNAITPSYTKNTSCLENLLCMILQAESPDEPADTRLLFMDHWRMNYDKSQDNFGDKTKFFTEDMIEKLLKNFELYYGMKCIRDIPVPPFHPPVIQSLWEKYDYLLLCIDAFELKSLSLYQKFHVPHYVLVSAVHPDGLLCYDYMTEVLIDEYHFYNGAMCFIGIQTGESVRPRNLWAYDLHGRISTLVREDKMFDDIKEFATELDNWEILYEEMNSVPKDDVLLLRLPNSLTAIGSSRYHFGRVIEAIPDIPNTAPAARQFQVLSQTWYNQIKRLAKFKFTKKVDLIYSVQTAIVGLADIEKELAWTMLDVLKKDGIYGY